MTRSNPSLRFARSAAAAVFAAAVSVTLMASPVLAQPGGRGGPGGGGMREMFQTPAINTRQMEKYTAMLALTDDQKTAADALFDGYSQAVRDNNEAIREKTEKMRDEFRESRDPAVWDGMRDVMRSSRDERKKIEQTFATDLKANLTPEQAEKWPAVERAQRRDQTLRRGFLSGERVDLIVLVEEAELPDEAETAVKPVLDQYETDMDRELTRRNDTYEKSFEKMAELRQEGDMEGVQALVAEGREAGARVRDLNRRYARQLSDLLPEEKRATFDQAFKRASFPDVYRPSLTSRSLTAVVGFADITEDQKAAVATLAGNYERTLAATNEKLAKAIEENEMNFNIGNFMNRDRDRDEGPMGELRRERRDLDRATLDSLKKLLSPDQQERLPKPEDGQRRDRGGDRRDRDMPDPT